MSEQEQNIETVKKGYDAFSAGDIEAVMSVFDDNVEWMQPGNSTISGTYHGKGELGSFLAKMAEKPLEVRVNRLLADGDTVVALTDVVMDGNRTTDADVFTLRDGKTVRVEIHADTALMEKVYGTKQAATQQ
ncbi:nuclear transport factor 2 family protein [Mycolicibacterium baixiangningiae]|uniref:nuclear transport factor 2 family protein n=1 Tax=Mycolicibacterium baixiangningiae TaxID=2761578 RepID=UPI0018689E51|nr:nuclear transport factor 2 family protein [Mycolicibacterium baixiangningiae]